MVLIGQVDKLLLLAKADRQDSAKQLIRLLALDDDFKTVESHNKLRKNAYALLRLQRYKGIHYFWNMSGHCYMISDISYYYYYYYYY